ncbi:MAG: transposase [Burkholderiales bacterium]
MGVSPRQRQSGSSVKGRTMISRTGHADLRKALYMWGHICGVRSHNPTFQSKIADGVRFHNPTFQSKNVGL